MRAEWRKNKCPGLAPNWRRSGVGTAATFDDEAGAISEVPLELPGAAICGSEADSGADEGPPEGWPAIMSQLKR